MKKFASVLLLATSVSVGGRTASQATEFTGADLLSLCNSNNETVKAGCGLYLLGAVEGIAIGTIEAHGKRLFCIPNDRREMPQLMSAFQKVSREVEPQDLKLPAVAAVAAAMEQAFPCKKAN
jgi:hypothetical protein